MANLLCRNCIKYFGILLYFSMVVYIDKSQFDNFISIHTKQLVLGLTAFFLPKF